MRTKVSDDAQGRREESERSKWTNEYDWLFGTMPIASPAYQIIERTWKRKNLPVVHLDDDHYPRREPMHYSRCCSRPARIWNSQRENGRGIASPVLFLFHSPSFDKVLLDRNVLRHRHLRPRARLLLHREWLRLRVGGEHTPSIEIEDSVDLWCAGAICLCFVSCLCHIMDSKMSGVIIPIRRVSRFPVRIPLKECSSRYRSYHLNFYEHRCIEVVCEVPPDNLTPSPSPSRTT